MRFKFDKAKSEHLRKKRGFGFEEREDNDGAYYHLVTLWKSTKAEEVKYEENS